MSIAYIGIGSNLDDPESQVQRALMELDEMPPLVVACSHEPGSTFEQVAAVRQRQDRNRQAFDALFDQIDALSLETGTVRTVNYLLRQAPPDGLDVPLEQRRVGGLGLYILHGLATDLTYARTPSGRNRLSFRIAC